LGTILSFRAANSMGALAVTRLQMISAALVLAVIACLMPTDWAILWRFGWVVVVSSIVGVLIPNLAFMACLSSAGPGLAQALFATRTPFMTLLGLLLFGQNLTGHSVMAVVLVTLGIVLVAAAGDRAAKKNMASRMWISILLGLVAASGSAIGVVMLLPVMEAGIHPLVVSAVRTGFSALFFVLTFFIGPLRGVFSSTGKSSVRQMALAIVPGMLGYVVAVTAQLWSLAHLPVGVSAALSSLAPVLILPIMWMMSGKAAKPIAWGGAVVVCVGVALIRV
jgi:drug/metabolite transporter (DMT)-like permease